MTMDRNNNIDILKFLACLLVIFMHADYPYRDIVYPLNGLASSTFFCISGFFLYDKETSVIKTNIRKVFRLFLFALIIYFAKHVIFCAVQGQCVFLPSLKTFARFLIFNEVSYGIHLWYLPAYIYVLFILILAKKANKVDGLFYLIIPLLIIYSIVRFRCHGMSKVYLFRNAFLFGLPYFLMGSLIKKQRYNISVNYIKYGKLLFVIIPLLLVLRYVADLSSLLGTMLHTLDSYLLIGSIFIITICLPSAKSNVIATIGRYYSGQIYIFHLVVLIIVEKYLPLILGPYTSLYMWINPLFIFGITFFLVIFLKKVKVVN